MLLIPANEQSHGYIACSNNVSVLSFGNSVNQVAFTLLGDNDVVEMTWDLVPALVAI